MSEADTRSGIGDPTPEDCRRVADKLRTEGLDTLPDKLDAYADQLEADTDD